jgi:hypothetical protein
MKNGVDKYDTVVYTSRRQNDAEGILLNRLFVSIPYFEKCWEELGLTDRDLQFLEKFLLKNPQAGG